MRKYSCRRPSSANALAAKTRYASRVRPKIAGIESTAKSRSVVPIAMMTMSIGVMNRLPSSFVVSLSPWYSSVVGSTRFAKRRIRVLLDSSSWSFCARTWAIAV